MSGAGSAHSEEALRFLDLPLEIRILIYEQYFFGDGDSCHVFQASPWLEPTASPDPERQSEVPRRPTPLRLASRITAVPLLLSCRQVHTESIPILYAHARFHFDDLVALHTFLHRVPPPHRDLVRVLHLDWTSFAWFDIGCALARELHLREHWRPACAALSEMGGLRDLRIRIPPGPKLRGGVGIRGRAGCDMTYLEPLKTVKAENFVLEL
ncbi:hypothetical protein VTK73DRAFT_8918 [Phialemonium thermophilum]|uniref:DUF7730 domain-containing protein n=1 Tax=Phialemonium thermophilum TaxID=223376 RepID=A0ABR3W637_9PEZI